jgi:starch-binding outer membrane protein, SusD/RagB family
MTQFSLLRELKNVLIFLAFFSFYSCKSFVEVGVPVTMITAQTVYANNNSAAAAMTSIYSNMIGGISSLSSGRNSISFLQGMAADELKNYSTDAISLQFYQNALISNNSYFWTEIYKEIYVTNAVIIGCENSTALSTTVKQQLIGEAKFMRAFLYFYAVNLYGSVPLALSTDYKINSTLSRASEDDVYKQIIGDLKDADNLLPINYATPTGAATTLRVRPNKAAAMSLLARVYLYTKNWNAAKIEADSVISNVSQYNLESDLNQVFSYDSKEAIWQLQPVYPGLNTFDAYYFILTSTPGTGRFYAALSDDLLNVFEPGDARLANWVGQYQSANVVYSYPFKYKKNVYNPQQSLSDVTEYLMVLRLAEQYLIRAEARVENEDISGANLDLNIIRRRSGLSDVTITDKTSLLNAIFHERQVELFTEWGHRWFDLKRTGQLNNIMPAVTQSKGGSWSPDAALLPIPRSEILLNRNLVQNPGYK